MGLFARARAEYSADAAVDDFGLSFARLIYTPWFSGLAAVGGVLITSGVLVTSIQDSGLSGDGSSLDLLAVFSNSSSLLIVAAVFGLTPDLIIRRLSQQAEKYKQDLKSTDSSKSTDKSPLTGGTA